MAAGSDPLDHVWIVGPGRLGLALGLALHRAGMVRTLTFSGRSAAPPARPLLHPPAPATYRALGELPRGVPPALVAVTVPDAEIPEVARDLAALDLSTDTVVLHTSGALGADALAPVAARGVAVGSMHPLVAVADAELGAERLRGAWYALEGDARAVAAAAGVVGGLGGRVLELAPGGKPLYHAAAVFASNYLVTLMAVAERMLAEAGAGGEEARAAVAALAAGAVAAAGERGVVEGLTGPISRGDSGTVQLHLQRLSPPDALLYSTLARETLALARRQGLDRALADRIEIVLNRKP